MTPSKTTHLWIENLSKDRPAYFRGGVCAAPGETVEIDFEKWDKEFLEFLVAEKRIKVHKKDPRTV